MLQVKQKAAAKPKKLSAVFKASMKAKASLKDKPAQKQKNLKKQVLQNATFGLRCLATSCCQLWMPLKAVADKQLVSAEAPKEPIKSHLSQHLSHHHLLTQVSTLLLTRKWLSSQKLQSFSLAEKGQLRSSRLQRTNTMSSQPKAPSMLSLSGLLWKQAGLALVNWLKKRTQTKDIFQVGFFDSTGVSPSRTHHARTTWFFWGRAHPKNTQVFQVFPRNFTPGNLGENNGAQFQWWEPQICRFLFV